MVDLDLKVAKLFTFVKYVNFSEKDGQPPT